mgnify:FL=1
MSLGLARTSLLNGAAVATRLAAGLALNKVLAVYIGPAGFGVIGQFQSLVAMLGALAGGAFGNGVTKLTAERSADPARQLAVWRTAATLALMGSAAAAGVLLLFGGPLAGWLLNDASLASVMAWLALALVGIALNGLVLAALAGLKAVGAFVAASIAGSLLSVVVAVTLVVQAGLYGALVAVAVGQAVASVASVVAFRHVWKGRWSALLGPIDRPAARALGGFALMAAASAVVLPLGHIAIREGLVRLGGAELAGLWQAMFRLSDTHLLLLTTTLSLHFLPHFAEIGDGTLLRAAVAKGYRFVLPLVCATALATWLLREPLVKLLFTREFLPLTDALAWQLVGDVLKIGSWVPAFTMISHARTRLYIASEVVFTLVLIAACLAFAARFGLTGAAIGYALTYALYWVFVHYQLGRLTTRLRPPPMLTNGHAGP